MQQWSNTQVFLINQDEINIKEGIIIYNLMCRDRIWVTTDEIPCVTLFYTTPEYIYYLWHTSSAIVLIIVAFIITAIAHYSISLMQCKVHWYLYYAE